jgi:hypothetical protein
LRRRPGFVYLVTNPAWPGYVKAGAAKTLKGRLADFQTASPHRDFTLRSAILFKDRFEAEGKFKRRMRGFRVKGTEWFHLHPDDANAALVSILEKENI